ncbi:hypothetical protein ACLF6K_34215 [Streptomyces xanthophaeus]
MADLYVGLSSHFPSAPDDVRDDVRDDGTYGMNSHGAGKTVKGGGRPPRA